MIQIKFSKFDGGNIVSAGGDLVEVTDKYVIVKHQDVSYSFRRTPGSKSGYGIGAAKNWRLGLEERNQHVHPENLKKR